MLSITRKEGEVIRVDGPAEIRIGKISGHGRRVKLLIEADPSTTILRGELDPLPVADPVGTPPVGADASRI